MENSPGAHLALLLLRGFNSMVAVVAEELERQGHPGVTANHEFALRAVAEGAQGASELGRALGVSKQAAAKVISALEQLGYLRRQNDTTDARRKLLIVTPRGYDMMSIGAQSFDRLRGRLAAAVGPAQFAAAESVLAEIVAATERGPVSTPGSDVHERSH